MGVNSESISQVLQKLVRNQNIDSSEENHVSRLCKDLGLSRPTVIEAIQHLEEWGVVERNREGQKKKIRVNNVVVQAYRKDEGSSGDEFSELGKV